MAWCSLLQDYYQTPQDHHNSFRFWEDIKPVLIYKGPINSTFLHAQTSTFWRPGESKPFSIGLQQSNTRGGIVENWAQIGILVNCSFSMFIWGSHFLSIISLPPKCHGPDSIISLRSLYHETQRKRNPAYLTAPKANHITPILKAMNLTTIKGSYVVFLKWFLSSNPSLTLLGYYVLIKDLYWNLCKRKEKTTRKSSFVCLTFFFPVHKSMIPNTPLWPFWITKDFKSRDLTLVSNKDSSDRDFGTF